MKQEKQIRQPIVTVAGHVDHGKTSLLDAFRGSKIQEGEAGGITQKISFTKYPIDQLKKACPLIEHNGLMVDLPGLLFIDTPGHAAFTSLRKRGGSLADLAILVVSIKDGIKPQTAEVLKILKEHKTPFLIALNKVDTISGWQKGESLKESIESQAEHAKQDFQQSLLIFQGSLREHGFDSDLFYEMSDFKNKVAIVPCSATTGEGVPELLMMLCGLSQKFLKDQLTLGSDAKGVVLEVKKEKNMDCIESILYDGVLKECDEIAIAGFGETVVSKVRALEEIEPLSFKYKCKKEVVASTGIKMHLTEKKGVLSGMPFRKIDGNLEEIKKEFSAEVDSALRCDKQGIIVKADSLGSLEALMSLLRDEQINIVKAGIGPIGKTDLISAKANLEINELDSVIIGFGVDVEEGLELGKVKVISDQVVYKIIEDLGEWRKQRQGEIERERMMGLSSICKLEVLDQYVFRNSNPAIFGVRVVAGKAKPGVSLIKEDGESIARIKQLQLDKDKVDEAAEGSELAIALPGVAFDRRLKGNKFLYSDMGEKQFKAFKKNKDLLSSAELKVLQEIADIKRRKNEEWGL